MQNFRHDYFSFHGFEPSDSEVYEGWHNPQARWNGWAIPYLTTTAAIQLVKDQNEYLISNPGDFYEMEVITAEPHHSRRWTFYTTWHDTDGTSHREPVLTVEHNGQLLHAIGGMSWVWDEATDWDGTSQICDNCGDLLEDCYPHRTDGKCAK